MTKPLDPEPEPSRRSGDRAAQGSPDGLIRQPRSTRSWAAIEMARRIQAIRLDHLQAAPDNGGPAHQPRPGRGRRTEPDREAEP